MHASINRFFNKNPIGRVLNRLSGDIEKVDASFPWTFSNLLKIGSQVVTAFFMISLIANPYFMVFVLLYFFLCWKIQRDFSKANIEMTRLNSITKSPFVQLFTDSVHGIVQIRNQNKMGLIFRNTEEAVEKTFACSLGQRSLYFWLAIRLSLYSFLFVVPAFAYMIWRSGYSTLNLGVVINFLLMIIDDIRSFMTSMADMENNFVSFDRCNQYLAIPPEDGYKYFDAIEGFLTKNHSSKLEIKKIESKAEKTEAIEKDSLSTPLLDKPRHTNLKQQIGQKGIDLQLSNVKVKYSKDLPYVLKGIDLHIQPGEKVGIIGRTGAGKTSFVNLFVRFFDEYEGSIKLNDSELRQLYLESLRNNVTLISQDSYFFEGSLRENLDPKGVKTDEEIEDLLREAEIFDKVATLGGLDWKLKDGGKEMSFGEKQIYCFVRAIINTRGLIIMDEATSNLDVKSEDVLEKLKDKYMRDATVLIIAHRLNTIHSCDKVLILEKGKVQRFVDRTQLSTSELDYFKNYLKMFD